MKRTLAALALGTSLAGTAQADDTGFQLSKGFATGGFVASGAGPVITIGSIFLIAGAANNTAQGNGNGNGILAGGAGVLVGMGITALGPPIVVGSSIGGYLAVKDMGGSPSFVPAAIGIGGFGVQVLGWTLTIAEANRFAKDPFNAKGSAVDDFVRFAGWTTQLVGGGLQLSANGKAARSSVGYLPPQKKVQVALIPSATGGMLVGRF